MSQKRQHGLTCPATGVVGYARGRGTSNGADWIHAFGTCSRKKSVTKPRADCHLFPAQPFLAWPHRISRQQSAS